MILSDVSIKKAIASGLLEIDNFQDQHLNADSYDVTLNPHGWGIVLPTGSCKDEYGIPVIDPLIKDSYKTQNFSESEVLIRPGQFLLGSINERIRLGNGLVCELTGKSSLARLGLAVHVTAGFGDAGWNGIYVLEFVNFNSHGIELTAGMPIAQLIFHKAKKSKLTYADRKKSKYQDQVPGQGSKYYLNNKEFLDEKV